MKTEDVVAGLIERFPDQADRVKAWAADYYHALATYEGPRLQSAFDTTIAEWKYRNPPKPADIVNNAPSDMYSDLPPDELRRKYDFYKDRARGGVGAYGFARLTEEMQRRGYLVEPEL